jgi:DNA-binding NtrC family response regulator
MKKKGKILIVDDDFGLLESTVLILENEGFFVETASNGKEAENKVMMQFYNVIIIDLKLPDISGIELLTKINSISPRTKKIILTGYPDTSSAINALNEKADAYLVKPFNSNSLINLINENIINQIEELEFTQDKVLQFIQNRVKELDSVP